MKMFFFSACDSWNHPHSCPALFCVHALRNTDIVRVSHHLPTHFRDVKTMSPTREETSLKAHSKSVVELGLDPGPNFWPGVPCTEHSRGPYKRRFGFKRETWWAKMSFESPSLCLEEIKMLFCICGSAFRKRTKTTTTKHHATFKDYFEWQTFFETTYI